MAKTKKMYLILSKEKKYLFGVFPHTEQGKKDAIKYQKKLKKEQQTDTYISEK